MRNVLNAAAIVMVCALICVTSHTAAAEPEEMRARAKALRTEAAELSAQGRKEEAAKLERAVEELSSTADKMDEKQKPAGKANAGEKKVGLKEPRGTKGLDAKGLDAKGMGVKGSKEGGKKVSVKRSESAAGEGTTKDAAQRVKHLRTAAQHLKAAQMPELSSKVWSQADRLEAEVKLASVKKRSDGVGDKPDGAGDVKSLRQEVTRLRTELSELRQRVR